MKNQKKLIILTGPSGVGKGTVVKEILIKKKIFGFQYLQLLKNPERERGTEKITSF